MTGQGSRGAGAGRTVLNWLLVYGGWAAISVLAVVAAFAVRRTLVMAYTTLGGDRWALGLVDKWSLFGLGILALIGILYCQYYLVNGYPGGPHLGDFPRRLWRVLIIEAAVLGPALLLRLAL